MENSIIIYSLKVSVAILLFYGLYVICLKNDTFHILKRYYLLFIVFASSLYPLMLFDGFHLDGMSRLYEVILPEIEVSSELSETTVFFSFSPTIYTLILLVMLCGIIFLLSKLSLQIYRIVKLRSTHKAEKSGEYQLINLDSHTAPFSFFKWIFLPKDISEKEDRHTIIAHECVHANQYHSIDILLYELFSIIFWWNPIVWMLKKEMKINLEYLADEKTLHKGLDAKRYQYLLLEITNYNTGIHIVNNFNVSQLKKRIIMINKKKSSGRSIYKYLFIIPVCIIALSLNATNIINKDNNVPATKDEPYTTVEEMPRFPGGDRGMMEYIASNLKYPEVAVKNQTEGRAVVRFVVSETGNVTDVSMVRNLSPECDAEAMRVVREMPKWTPGKQGGKAVAVYYTLPIEYKLGKREDKK